MSSPPETYLTTSFVGDLSYQPSASQAAGLAHTFVTGRKTWKTLKSKKNEAVWPVHIEAALFEALEIYRPASSGDPKLLRRFPKRNRFISDYIFRVTGKARSPKQVGSRLQQLRDTCQEDRVLKLLSRREFPPLPGNTSYFCRRSDSLPSPGTLSHSLPSSTSTSPVSTPTHTEFTNPVLEPINLVTFDLSYHVPVLVEDRRHVYLDKAALLDGVAPFVSFSSTERGQYRSMYCVFFEDGLVHSEVTDFTPHASTSRAVVYQTKLVPQYWETLAMLDDLSRYTIAQDIIKVTDMEDAVLFSTTYKFKSPTAAEECKANVNIVDLEYSSDVELSLSGSPHATPHLGPSLPLCALRPSPAAAYLDVPREVAVVQPAANVWFDQCQYGIAMPQPVVAQPVSSPDSLEFINLSSVRRRIEPSPSGDGHVSDSSYINPAYWS